MQVGEAAVRSKRKPWTKERGNSDVFKKHTQ